MALQLQYAISLSFHSLVLAHHLIAMKRCHEINEGVKSIMNDGDMDQRVMDMADFGALFFTSWNLLFQMAYFILAFCYDLIKLTSNTSDAAIKIKLYKGYIFTSLVFPCTLLVSGMFWSVFSINRELVMPEVLDDYVPEWLNHSVHTNILIFLVFEVLLASQKLPSFKAAIYGLSIITVIYNTLFFITYYKCGRWIYGLFYVLSWPERIVLPIFNYVVGVLLMRIGIAIQRYKYGYKIKNC